MNNRESMVAETDGFTRIDDNYGRRITYLRLAITDRCNLRCRYCMPEEGVRPIDHKQTLSYEEMERLVRLFVDCGVTKVRLTGGEPFVRRGCLDFIQMLKEKIGVSFVHITTNGVETAQHLQELKRRDISGINLSLDTLDPERFRYLTRRDRLQDVMRTFYGCLEYGIPLKVNSVVMEDTSDAEIIQLAELVRENDICLRFIELMPFSGKVHGHDRREGVLFGRLERLFPGLKECPLESAATAREFTLSGFRGRIGIIEGHSRNFCKTCNKVRITPQGMLKACLYDNGILDLRTLVRSDASDLRIIADIQQALRYRNADGHETEELCRRLFEPSMSQIGG
ncbi:MAG: GTP 3',8-cyclase MoaA [Desulfobacterales bacterium]|nr:MAG: GTP 3',8-cyclase MoaA [Desulfobacterales bacterium]